MFDLTSRRTLNRSVSTKILPFLFEIWNLRSFFLWFLQCCWLVYGSEEMEPGKAFDSIFGNWWQWHSMTLMLIGFDLDSKLWTVSFYFLPFYWNHVIKRLLLLIMTDPFGRCCWNNFFKHQVMIKSPERIDEKEMWDSLYLLNLWTDKRILLLHLTSFWRKWFVIMRCFGCRFS